ncbi:MAG: hypothetical protein U9R68_04085, partial [Planctomycetota bacterium]|nr:hypothetical protein [Planctomycetota bacterium]
MEPAHAGQVRRLEDFAADRVQPHEPVLAGEKYLEMYPGIEGKTQHYYGCLTAMDEQMGRLRDE